MTNLIPFEFENNPVRVIERGDELWFVGKDVCDVLSNGNHKQVLSRLDDDERDGVQIVDRLGREQTVTVINESGLYSLILTSRKPEAKPFKKWVTSEVLPTIRKTGSYSIQQSTPDIAMPKAVREAVRTFNAMYSITRKVFKGDPNEALLSANKSARNLTNIDVLGQIEGVTLESPKQVRFKSPRELGKPYDMSAQAVNKALKRDGFQIIDEYGDWKPTEKGVPFARLLDTGKKRSSGTSVHQLKWSPAVMQELSASALPTQH